MKGKLPNIVMIVMDTVGAKHMSLYGYHRRTTPNLERIAENCTVYTRCFAPACWTIPSHGSMFTGLYPSQHGAYEGKFFLNQNVHHIVTVLKMLGYQTFGISSNGLVSPASGLCPDFDHFNDFGVSHGQKFFGNKGRPPAEAKEGDKLWSLFFKGLNKKERARILLKYLLETGDWKSPLEVLIKNVAGRVDGFLHPTPFAKSSTYTSKTVRIFHDMIKSFSNQNSSPFFMFINFMEAHELYKPPLKWRQFSRWVDKQVFPISHGFYKVETPQFHKNIERLCNLYDDELVYLDHIINDMWNILKKSSVADQTVVIITSDHGEHFGEKKRYGHQLSLYNELIWVPLLIHFPKGYSVTGTQDRLISLNDLFGTILDLAKCPLPCPESSVSILSSSKRKLTIAQYVFPESHKAELNALKENYKAMDLPFSPPIFAIITDKGKKIIESRDNSLEVYNLNNDIDECNNLAGNMSSESLEGINSMLEVLKKETSYLSAADGQLLNKDSYYQFTLQF